MELIRSIPVKKPGNLLIMAPVVWACSIAKQRH